MLSKLKSTVLGVYIPLFWNWRRWVVHNKWAFSVNSGAAGEGGSFALYQGLYPRDEQNLDEDRTLSGESYFGKSRNVAKTLKEKARWPLLLWVSDARGLLCARLEYDCFSVCLVLRE